MSSELKKTMDDVLEKHPLSNRMSYFQLKNYIIGKEHTLHGKMWQCIREITTRRDSLESIILQIEDINDKLELLDIQKERLNLKIKELDHSCTSSEDKLTLREYAIKNKQIDRDRKQLEKNGEDLVDKMKGIQEESNYYLQAFESLKKSGDWKEYDDEQAQEAFWNAKLAHELNMRLVLGQPIDIELGKTIEALNDQAPAKQRLMGIINERQTLIREQKARIEEK